MKHFHTFDDTFKVAKEISNLSMESYTDHISITKCFKYGNVSLILRSPSKSKPISTLKSDMNVCNTSVSLSANSRGSFYLSVDQGLLQNALHIGGYGKSEFSQIGFDDKRYFPKGKYCGNVRFANSKINNSYFGVCAYSDTSKSFLSSVSLQKHNLCARITSSEMSSYLALSYYYKNGVMCYIKFNTSAPQLQNGELGYMREWKNKSATYMLLNPFKKQFLFGGVSYYSQKLSFAFQSVINIKEKKKIDFQAGVKVSSETDLRVRLDLGNNIEIFSQFKPRDWLQVTIRSRLGIDSVSYGWSLDFMK